jgi:hypothetical protein
MGFGILREDHVSVYPGYFFDFDREAYIVLSLLPPPSFFKRLQAGFCKGWLKYKI